MDTFSHAVYGYAVTRTFGVKMAWWGALLGAAPDVLYSGAALVRRLWQGGWSAALGSGSGDASVWRKDGPPLPADLVADYYDFYRYTHSLVIWLVIGLLFYAVTRRKPWLLAAPVLHVLMDIPSHERYLTPFLFPLSDVTIMGVSWSRPPMLVANAVLLLLTFIYLYRLRVRERATEVT